MGSPKISVIIPVYNVEKYLRDCLDSVVNQTYRDIEIICVNDSSTDSSLAIVEEYAAKDNRIIVVDKPQNEGTMLARKSGVDVSSGDYTVFLDSDDYFAVDLCQFIADITQKEKADIIQFSIGIKGYSVTDKDIVWMKNAFEPVEKSRNRDEIITDAFITRQCTTSLVGKIFKTQLCKKVHAQLPFERCYLGEDIFTYFIFSCFAQSYKGIKTPEYYVYRYGAGVENSSAMQISKFEQYCKMANWVKYAEDFLKKSNGTQLQYKACDNMQQRMFEDCCKIYKNRIAAGDKASAAKLLVQYWNNTAVTDRVMQNMLEMSFEKFEFQTNVPVYVKTAAAYDENNRPKVSVVIPAYNVQQYIGECLDSVVNQTLKEIEIVCVNDGSPDNSLEIIEKYAEKDNRITVVSRKNGGLSAARNSGLQQAKGEYVYFLDSDDFITADALEKLYHQAHTEKLDILYFGVQNYFDNEDIKKQYTNDDNYYQRKQFFKNAVRGDELFEAFLNENMFICCVPFQLIKTDFLKSAGITFKEGMLHEDELFSPQLIVKADRTMVIEDKFYMRRIREDSITTSAPTHRNFVGYFIAYTSLTAVAVCDKTISAKAVQSLGIYTKKLYNTARRIYRQLSKQQRRMAENALPQEFKLLLQPIKEQETLLRSATYRAGNLITMVPRKVNAVSLSLKEKGVKGTLQLVKKYYFKK